MQILKVGSRHVSTLLLITCALATSASAASIGKARIARAAPSSFDKYTRNPNAAEKQWIRDHYARLIVFDPYFDSRLSWYPDAWAYENLYAIHVGSSFASAHPDWILRDAAGNPLYVRYDCSGGTCPQYAGDLGNPAFRADWIARARTILAKGYRGLYIDDVNMRIDRISDGNRNPVAPRDPRTGTAMTETNWRRYIAEFTEQIRAAFPSHEIVHNALWFVPTSDPYVQRQLLAADVFNMERGVNDAGIVRGTSTYGFETFLGVIDWLHQRGRAVVLLADASGEAAREYGLATHLLMTTGADYGGNVPGAEPDNWWAGYDVDLGAPVGARTRSGDVFQREFQGGRVIVNQPGAGQATVQLGGTFLRINGSLVTSVTLGAGQGVVLRRAGATTTSAPASSSTTSSTSTTRPSTSTTRASTSTTRVSTSTTRASTSSTSTSTTRPTTSTTRASTSTTRPSTSTTRPSTSTTSTTTSTTRPSTSTTRASTSTTRASTSSSTSTTTASTSTTIASSACPPGLPDLDADGRRDTCDPCTNLVPTGQQRARLTLSRLLPPANDDRLKFKGYFTGVPSSPPLDPVANGVRVLVVDGVGSTRIDVTVPGGAYDSGTGAGWQPRGGGASWQYRNSGRIVPRTGGIEKVKLRMLGDPDGRVAFDVKGRNGDYRLDSADLPLVATLVLDAPVARTGQCGEARFPVLPPQKPSCSARQNGNTISCN